MKLSSNQLQPLDSPLIGFGGKRIDALGKISLPVSFGGQENARTEYVTFDVVDLTTPTMPSSEEGSQTNSTQPFIWVICV